jgi:hypothetical protein
MFNFLRLHRTKVKKGWKIVTELFSFGWIIDANHTQKQIRTTVQRIYVREFLCTVEYKQQKPLAVEIIVFLSFESNPQPLRIWIRI